MRSLNCSSTLVQDERVPVGVIRISECPVNHLFARTKRQNVHLPSVRIPAIHVGDRLHAFVCIATLCILTWALLSPDPFAAVEGGSLGWVAHQNDAILHVGSFIALSVIMFSFAMRLTRRISFSWVLALSAYAVGTEILQGTVPGRTCDFGDVVADLTGIMVGFFVIQFSAALILRRSCSPAASQAG